MLNGENLHKKKPNVWTALPQGKLKINVDVAIDKKRQCSGLCAAIRDNTGKYITTTIKNSKFKGDVSFVEVEAKWGLHTAKEASLQSIILEINSQKVADLINNRKDNST